MPDPGSLSQTTAELRLAIATQFSKLSSLAPTITLALNQEYLSPGEEAPLKNGDEVALIPPISGG